MKREKAKMVLSHYPPGGTGEVPFSLIAWREELGSSGLMMGLTIKLRLYSNSVAKMTSGWGNLHFRNTVEHLIAPRWANIALVLLKSNYNEA